MTINMNPMRYSIIVAHDLNRGIGKAGTIPWRLPADLKRFKDITTQKTMNCVVMGRKTWDSIPPKFRPLPDRINIILSRLQTSTIKTNDTDTFVCSSFDDLDGKLDVLSSNNKLEEVFFIGGSDIYSAAKSRYPIHRYYLTQVLQKYDCDAFFPTINLTDYKLIESSTQVEKETSSRFHVYEKTNLNHLVNNKNEEEEHYLRCLRDVLNRGQYRDDRTKVGTLSLFEGKQFIFDISQRFPLLTTKRVFFRGLSEELFFFFSHVTELMRY